MDVSDDEKSNSIDDEEGPDQILYDVVTYREWEQEPELVKPTEKPVWPRKTGRGWWGKVAGTVLPPGVEKLIAVKLPWHFAVSSDASLVAILQDSLLEVWSSRDNYNALVGRCQIGRDPAPQWRHVVWSQDTSLLAVAHSSGCVDVHDTLAGHVYSIISPSIAASQPGFVDAAPRTGPTSGSYAAVFFTNARVRDKKWISELVLVEFSGQVNSFLVSMSGYQEATRHHVGWPVTASVFCKDHNLLLTAGHSPLAGKPKLTGRASQAGITAWRLLNDAPHYEPLMDEDEQSLLYKTSFRFPFSTPPPLDHVVRLSVSGCGRKLAAVHQSGTVSIWQLPGLTLESSTQLTAQPSYDEMNPALLQLPGRRRSKVEFLADPQRYHPVDVGWWNPESVILARMSGAVSVLRVSNLSNLFGESPEFLEGVPSISQCFEKGFFGLECEQVVRGRRMTFDDSAGEDPDFEVEEDEEDDEESWLTLGKRSAASIAYFLTDSERFAPPKKKARISRRTYRLLAFVSTTPEELYKRKIAAEEYGEAIMLAQHYKLDTDPVYERQWRMSTKSMVAIHDYLSKMKRRATVFKECLETVPTDIDAAKELLVYGLKGTDLEAVLALSKDDSGELILCDGQRVLEQIWPNDDMSPEDIVELQEEKEREARIRLVAMVNWQTLTLVQKDLIATRRKLLYYLDVLDTYETILGQRAHELFDPRVYRQLRKRTPLENCLTAARAGDCNTIMAMMGGCHADATLPHWLPLVANFPETTKAAEYREILPSLDLDGKVVPFFRSECREHDWCEQPVAVKWVGEGTSEELSSIYEGQSNLQKFNTAALTPELISTWYQARAISITKHTNLPALGLELLQLGLERGLELDFSLLHRLRTLDTLVYEVQIDVELDQLQDLSTIEQMKLIMSGAKEDTITAVRAWLLPFLQRLEDDEPGSLNKLIQTYCMELAETDLTFPALVVDNSGPDKTGPILFDLAGTVELAIDCAYAHKTGAQIELLEQIYRSVSSYFSKSGSRNHSRYILPKLTQERLLLFREDLEASKILYRNGVVKPLSLFRDNKNSIEVMTKLVVALARRAEGANPPLDQEGWRAVLRDLQSLQHQLPIISVQSVYQIYCESLLSSGSSSNITLAGQEMHHVDDKVSLVLAAWKHYYTSSLNLHDPTMDLARQVLCLIRPPPREIQEANDLIAALQSLSDFSITDVLPIAVLQSSNRLELAQMALNAKPTAYKNTQRLMKLASLLKIENPHDGGLEGIVWGLVAKKALDVSDFMAAHTACNNFIAAGYTEGWKICYALAATADFNDLDKCVDLLNFALTHCQDDNIEDVMRTLITVQQKSLHRNISVKMEINADVGSEEDMDVFGDTLSETGNEPATPITASNNVTNQLLNVKRLSSQYLMDNAVTQRVWQHTASWITQIADTTQLMQKSFHEDEILKTDFDRVCFPTFYIDLFPGEKVGFGSLDLTYNSFSLPSRSSDASQASQQVLRIGLLSDTMTVLTTKELVEEVKQSITKELLSQLVPTVISQDIIQGLGLLLASHPDEAVPVLDNLPRTLPSISTATTYFSIFLAAKYLSSHGKNANDIFRMSPLALTKLGATLEAKDDSSSSATCQRQLESYLELASDSQQAAQLAGLAGDIDVERFTLDNKYKEDTILGLAMYTDEQNWKVTTGLARKYRIGLWLVMVTHLEAILVDTELSTEEARIIIDKRKLKATLVEDGEGCAKVMKERVLPLLDGRDIARLLLYYDLLESMNIDDDAAKHKQALVKIQEKCLQIDYNLLSFGSELSSILNQDNVDAIAEIVALIPNDQQQLAESLVYKSWANKMFFQHGKEKDNWIEAFSLIWKYLDHLSPNDFNELVNDCILSEQSLKLVPRPARGRIFKKALKFVEIKIAEKKEGDWKAVEDRLQLIKSHSEKFKSPVARDIISQTEDTMQKYFDKFELTGGEDNKILKLISDMVDDGEDRAAIENIIQIWKQDASDKNETVSSVMLLILQLSSDQMQDPTKPSFIRSPHRCIEVLAEDWSLPVDKVSELISPLCTSDKVPIPQRLSFVRLLKNLNADSQDDEGDGAMLAELYETQHALESFLTGEEVRQADLATHESRYELFERILGKCIEPRQLVELGWLTTKWPKFEENVVNSEDKNCWSRLLGQLLDQHPHDCSNFVVEIFKKIETEELPESVAKAFLNRCLDMNKSLYIHCSLHLDNPAFHDPVLDYVTDSQVEVSPEVLQLLLERGLGPRLMSTPVYPRLVALARDTDSESLSKLAGQMREAGQLPQAESLQMMVDSVPVALRTMAAVAKRLMAKK